MNSKGGGISGRLKGPPGGLKGPPGPQGPKGARGPKGDPGTGFKLASDGNFDIERKRLLNLEVLPDAKRQKKQLESIYTESRHTLFFFYKNLFL